MVDHASVVMHRGGELCVIWWGLAFFYGASAQKRLAVCCMEGASVVDPDPYWIRIRNKDPDPHMQI